MGFSDLSEHRINRGLLFSAAFIRKIAEDEKNAKDTAGTAQLPVPPLPVLKISVPIKRYRHTCPDKFFANTRVFLSDYDMEHAENDQISLFQVCNQIIHSYAWSVVHKGKRICGVLFASDREKEKDVFFLAIADWIKVIREVIEKSNI